MIYVDDKLPNHPKIYRAGAMLGDNGPAQALSVFLAGLAYAREHLTDGFLPDKFVASCGLVETPSAVAKALCSRKVRLWHRIRGGFRIHDYHDWNRPAAEIKKKRAIERKKKAESRANGHNHSTRGSSKKRNAIRDEIGPSCGPVQTPQSIANDTRTDERVVTENAALTYVSPPFSVGDKSRTSRARASTYHDPRTTTTGTTYPDVEVGSEELSVPKTRAVAAPRHSRMAKFSALSPASTQPATDGNYAVLVRIAHEAFEELRINNPSFEVYERVKELCATRHIAYGQPPEVPYDILRKAIESAATQRTLVPVRGLARGGAPSSLGEIAADFRARLDVMRLRAKGA